MEDLHSALDKLHAVVPHIAVSSISLPLPNDLVLPPPPASYTPVSTTGMLLCIASSRGSQRTIFGLPAIDGYFSGVGDLFSALVLAHFSGEAESYFAKAVSRALHTVQMILTQTHIKAKGSTMRDRELRIVQEQHHITSGLEWPGVAVLGS